MANTLEIQLSATLSQFQQQMGQAAGTLRTALQQMGSSFGSMTQPAQAAEKSTGGLLEKLREFRTDQVQQARVVRFYASELSSIIPAAEGVKSSISGLLGIAAEGLAGGGAFGIAFEGAKFLIEYFHRVATEAEDARNKASASLSKIFDDIWEKRQKLANKDPGQEKNRAAAESLQRLAADLSRTETEVKAATQAVDDAIAENIRNNKGFGPDDDPLVVYARKRRDAAIKAFEETQAVLKSQNLEQTVAGLRTRAAAVSEDVDMGRALAAQEMEKRVQSSRSEIWQLEVDQQFKLRAITAETTAINLQVVTKGMEGELAIRTEADNRILAAKAAASKAIEEVERQRQINGGNLTDQQAERQIRAIRKRGDAAVALLQRESEAEIAARREAAENAQKMDEARERDSVRRDLKSKGREIDRQDAEAEIDGHNRRQRLLALDLADLEDYYREKAALAGDDAQLLARLDAQKELAIRAARRRYEREEAQEYLQRAQWATNLASSIGNSFGQAFTSMISGAKSVGDAFKDLFAGILDAFLRMIEQMIAALVMSGILSFLGMIIGGPIGGALGSLGGRMLGGIGFRASGGPVSAGSPYIVGERGPELIVPSHNGTVLPAAAMGGDTYHITISALDGPSVYDTLVRHGGAVRSAFRRLAKDGR